MSLLFIKKKIIGGIMSIGVELDRTEELHFLARRCLLKSIKGCEDTWKI
ncbi:hypothetical protein YSY43_20030 [Paenibacillus sp. YSY-4.3]